MKLKIIRKKVKNENANLNNQINLKISSLDTIQKQLSIANQSIIDMQNELNNLEKSHSLGLNQLENIKINFIWRKSYCFFY